MTVKSATVWSGLVVCKDATGALATPSVGPVGVLYVDGVVNAASVTVTGSNPYKWTLTLPTLTAGQTVSMYTTATIATIATASIVAEDVADTVRMSDLGGGAGAITYTFTVNDGTNPIDGVEVWASTDSAGTNVVAGTKTTDALGQVVFTLDAGTYYAWLQRAGYNFTNPTSFVVS